MSIDLKIFSVCDHSVFKEIIQIESDYITLRIPRPISVASKLKLYINGYLISPDNSVSGYTLQNDTKSYGFQLSKIVFNNKRKSMDDFYEVSYSVISNLCPKCMGKRILNDISYNNVGIVNTVQNEEKLMQEIKKGILTELGSNPFHTWIGTRLSALVGNKIYNIDNLRANVIQEVTKYIDRYLDIQTKQAQFQSVTDRESFYQTISIDFSSNDSDPTLWTLTVIFQNRTGADMVFDKKIEIPSANVASSLFNLK